MKELKGELHRHLEDAILVLYTDPIEYYADKLHVSMKGLGTIEDTLIEIIASRPPHVLKAIIDKY